MKEKISRKVIAGLIISFFGVSVIAMSNAQGFSLNPRIMFLMLAAITFALFQISQKRLLKEYTSLEATGYAVWGAAVLLLPFGYTLPDKIFSASMHSTTSAIYLGIFPSAIAYLTWFAGLKRTPVSRAAVFFHLSPVFTVTIGYFWLGELPTLISLIGGVLVICGVIITNVQFDSASSE